MYFIQMSGIPGSGKSTLAKEISRVMDVVIVDHDVTKTSLLESMNDSDQNLGIVSYHLDWMIIESLILQNKNIIFDSPCLYEEIIEKGISLSQKYGYTYKYVECMNKNFSIVSERLTSRESKLSQIKEFDSYESFIQAINGSNRPEKNFLVVDSSNPLHTYFEDVIYYIENENIE